MTESAVVDSAVALPQSQDLMWPVLESLRRLGGSGTTEEIRARVITDQHFTEEQQRIPHGERQSELEYRLAWARTYLKHVDATTNSARGVWATTEAGERMSQAEVADRTREWKLAVEERRRARRNAGSETRDVEDAEDEADDGTEDWKDQLVARLLALAPDAFERLSQRLLREAGFVNVTVTGRVGDGGIDGVGVYRLSLVSFPTFFQCKRYTGAVAAGAVRDFRGAMVGRGEKGLLITTGTFTRGATAEASRDGAPPIELIDGDRLCDLLRQFGLGVHVEQRLIEDVTIDAAFFDELG